MNDKLTLDKLEQIAHRIDGCAKGLGTLSLTGYSDQKTNTNIIEELTLIVQEFIRGVQLERQDEMKNQTKCDGGDK